MTGMTGADNLIRNGWRAFVPVFGYFILQNAADRVLAAVLHTDTPSPAASVTAAAAAAIPLLLYLYIHSRPVWEKQPEKKRGIKGAVILACCLILGVAASLISARVMELAGVYKKFSNTVQEQLLAAPFYLLLTGPGILAPVAEELLYRGLCRGWLKESLGAVCAAVISSLLFAAGHFNLIQFLYAFPSGLIMCGAYEYYGGLAAPLLFHLGANLISVFLA